MAGRADSVVRGIVLRETDTREADRILTLLTAEQGKIAVIAKGVRRRNCKYAACAQSLAYSEWTIYEKGAWHYAREGTTLELFRGLRSDLDAMALGFYFAELTEAVTADAEPAPEFLRHLLNGLYALSELHKPAELVKAAFEIQFLKLAGYAPLAEGCAVCGRAEPMEPVLEPVHGIVRCRQCGIPGSALPLCGASLAALRHILYGDPKRLYAFTLGAESLGRLSTAAEGFLLAQMERRFRTLEFYRDLHAGKTQGVLPPSPFSDLKKETERF